MAIVFANGDVDIVLGRGDAEVIARLHVDKWRDVEAFIGGLPENRVVVAAGRHHIGVAFAEGVAHLVQHGGDAFVPAITIIDAQRIEDIAQDARKTEQANGAGQAPPGPVSLWLRLLNMVETELASDFPPPTLPFARAKKPAVVAFLICVIGL